MNILDSIDRIVELAKQLSEEHYPLLFRTLERNGIRPPMPPQEAYAKAMNAGGSDMLRAIASADSDAANNYAMFVDESPHEVTRKGASAHPLAAMFYALHVDKGYHEDTATGAAQDPETAVQYHKQICKPFDKTCAIIRRGACADPRQAYLYALSASACEETRAAACRDPRWAAYYARFVDQKLLPEVIDVLVYAPHLWEFLEIGLPGAKARLEEERAQRSYREGLQ